MMFIMEVTNLGDTYIYIIDGAQFNEYDWIVGIIARVYYALGHIQFFFLRFCSERRF